MSSESVTKLTTAFNPSGLVDTFVSMAPFVMAVVGTLTVVSLIAWGIRKVRRRLSGGVA